MPTRLLVAFLLSLPAASGQVVKKLSEPDKASRDKARSLIRSIFKAEYAKPRPEDQAKLAAEQRRSE